VAAVVSALGHELRSRVARQATRVDEESVAMRLAQVRLQYQRGNDQRQTSLAATTAAAAQVTEATNASVMLTVYVETVLIYFI
jgi:hypothetical protein